MDNMNGGLSYQVEMDEGLSYEPEEDMEGGHETQSDMGNCLLEIGLLGGAANDYLQNTSRKLYVVGRSRTKVLPVTRRGPLKFNQQAPLTLDVFLQALRTRIDEDTLSDEDVKALWAGATEVAQEDGPQFDGNDHNTIAGPGRFVWDVRLMKYMPKKENSSVQNSNAFKKLRALHATLVKAFGINWTLLVNASSKNDLIERYKAQINEDNTDAQLDPFDLFEPEDLILNSDWAGDFDIEVARIPADRRTYVIQREGDRMGLGFFVTAPKEEIVFANDVPDLDLEIQPDEDRGQNILALDNQKKSQIVIGVHRSQIANDPNFIDTSVVGGQDTSDNASASIVGGQDSSNTISGGQTWIGPSNNFDNASIHGGADSILQSVLGIQDERHDQPASLLDWMMQSLSVHDKVSRRSTQNRIEKLREDPRAQVLEDTSGLITIVGPDHDELALLDLDTVQQPKRSSIVTSLFGQPLDLLREWQTSAIQEGLEPILIVPTAWDAQGSFHRRSIPDSMTSRAMPDLDVLEMITQIFDVRPMTHIWSPSVPTWCLRHCKTSWSKEVAYELAASKAPQTENPSVLGLPMIAIRLRAA